MIGKPLPIKAKKIVSVDIPSFAGGLYQAGDENAPSNSVVASSNMELDYYGHFSPRRKMVYFLPDTVETTYQKFPVIWNGIIYYFTLDNGAAVFCKEGDPGWTQCSGTNSFVTNNGGLPKFLRVLNNVLILNGKNGDRLALIDLTTSGFPVIKYTAIADPSSPFTATYSPTTLSGSTFYIYYAFSYSAAVGETNLSPIQSFGLTTSRDGWNSMSTPGSITLTRPGTAPTGAKFWNVYMALSATGGSIQVTDMLQIAVGLNLASTTFVDDGSLSLNLSSTAPLANSTSGPRVENGITFEGNPLLFGDQDNPYAIWIGGGGTNALDFSISGGGYEAEPEMGSNYYPNSIVGFRTGTGIASLVVFFSNTEGVSRQALLTQQVATYGSQTFTIWGFTDQHQGGAGVAAANSAVNYLGQLNFLSTDGFISMDTAASRYNVLSLIPISHPIIPLTNNIKISAMDRVVGCAWENKFAWLIPSDGFDTPQIILIYDLSNPGIAGKGAWYSLDIAADWIGVVTPNTEPGFVYVSVGKSTYKLVYGGVTVDMIGGVLQSFATSMTGPIISSTAGVHNEWMALVQAVFYLVGVIGNITVGINYWNQNGVMKTRTFTYTGPTYLSSVAGGWGDTEWMYANTPTVAGWGASTSVPSTTIPGGAVDARVKVNIDDIANQYQWFISTDPGYNSYELKAVSFEGINLGVLPDLT